MGKVASKPYITTSDDVRVNKGLESLLVEVSQLKLDDKNARSHSPESIVALRKSLEKYGFQQPIVVQKGKVLAGNGRLQAAQELGWVRVPIIEWSGSEADGRKFAIADNQTADLSTWDYTALAMEMNIMDELADIEEWAGDIGFGEGQASSIMANAMFEGVEDSYVPKIAHKRGTLFIKIAVHDREVRDAVRDELLSFCKDRWPDKVTVQ